MHEHVVFPPVKPCDHSFDYCKKCDVVYCEKCKSEWVKKVPGYFEDVKKEMEKITRQRPNQWIPQGPQRWCEPKDNNIEKERLR